MSKKAPTHKVRHAAHIDARADGSVHASFAVQQGAKAAVLCLRVESGGDEVCGGSTVLSAAAIALAPDELFALVDSKPLAPWECRALGLYGDNPGTVAPAFVRFAEGLSDREPSLGGVMPSRTHENHLDGRYEVARGPVPCLFGIDARHPVPVGARGASSALPGHRVFPDRLHGYVRDWIDRLRGYVQGPAGLWFLSPDAWTQRVSAWLLAPGEAGERRRQAGRLQCGFAPVLAAEPAIAGAIDAGVAFEPELLKVAREWLPEALREGLDLARLRRLRGVDFAGMDRMVTLLGIAARVPLHLLPAPGDAPRELPWMLGEAMESLDRMGLPLEGVFADPLPRWLTSQDPERPAVHRYERLRTALRGALDMASSFSMDIVHPLMDGWRYRDVPLDRPDCERLAGRFLFEGLPLVRVMEVSRGWHDDLVRLRDAAASGVPNIRWPALFESFECGNGVSVTCLVTAQELDDEGCRGPDTETGMEGLNHCVGTYAEDCHAGDIHVASVRADGRRLSTAAFRVSDRDARLILDQHHGLRNSDPDPVAVDAIRRFMSAHARGEVRISPGALETREAPGPQSMSPEAVLRRVHAAWRPHLRQGYEDVLSLEACLVDLIKRTRSRITERAA